MRGLSGLIGKYFLTWKDGEIHWQGRVVEVYGDTHIMVVLFDWWDGNPCGEKLVPLPETSTWTFYDAAKAMRYATWQFWESIGFGEGTFEENEAFHDRLAALMG
ncbi:MAG TPA: hypothetical protein PLF11_08690 [Bacillota bacterium]|jgi:hypothetical protein|nr:hypothetical protein [Verrucomicrobiota bacterium]HOI37445.1 hypothetical protein [Bacillota bacterium]